MRMEDMILVSVDDHVVEPADMFDGRVQRKYMDQVPRLIHKQDGTDVWSYQGVELPNVAMNAVAGRVPEEYGYEPTALAEIRPGCYDIHARVKDMNANGVLASMNFPSFPQFCGQLFMRTADKDVAAEMVRAYNDWHIDYWAATYPGRIIPVALPMLWDGELCAAEVRRVAAKGCRGITFSENPAKLGLPSLHSDHWEPLWRACEEEGVIVMMHIGSSSEKQITALDAPPDVSIVIGPVSIIKCASDLLYSPVLRKHPNLKVALSEGGIGWLPYFLERVDYVFDHHHGWTGADFGGRNPSDVFHDQVITCFIKDSFGLEVRSHLNMDLMTWESDYPHSDSTWPFSPEILHEAVADLSDEDINKVTHENALRLWQFDPFAHIPKAQATVGALRSQVKDWDISTRATAVVQHDEKMLTAGAINAMADKFLRSEPISS